MAQIIKTCSSRDNMAVLYTMSKIDVQKLLLNFIPIILLYLLVSYTPEFVKFSHTILGKAFAIIIIIFYVKIDIYIGSLVCALVILYYQTDYVESFNNMLNVEEQDKEEEERIKDKQNKEEDKGAMDDVPMSYEGFENLNDAYPEQKLDDLDIFENKNKNKETVNFRKKHCEKGHLMHKGQIVKSEMASHVFPEIKQPDFNKCHICDPACNVDIIETIDKNIIVESDLLSPKNSNDMFEYVWDNMKRTTQGFSLA